MFSLHYLVQLPGDDTAFIHMIMSQLCTHPGKGSWVTALINLKKSKPTPPIFQVTNIRFQIRLGCLQGLCAALSILNWKTSALRFSPLDYEKTVTLQPHKAETPPERYSHYQASRMQFVGESFHEIQIGTGDYLYYAITSSNFFQLTLPLKLSFFARKQTTLPEEGKNVLQLLFLCCSPP